MPLIRQLSKYLMILPCGILLAVEWEPLMYPRGFKALLRIGEKPASAYYCSIFRHCVKQGAAIHLLDSFKGLAVHVPPFIG